MIHYLVLRLNLHYLRFNPQIANNLKIDIENVLKNYEPRVDDVVVEVNYPLDSNEIYIQIAYRIVGLTLPDTKHRIRLTIH